jgi:hypothetical protein
VSCGIHEDPVDLPPASRVIGGNSIGPLIIEDEDQVRPSAGSLRVRYQHIAGAIDQLGGGFLSSEEY